MKAERIGRVVILAAAALAGGWVFTAQGADERAGLAGNNAAKSVEADFEAASVGDVPAGWSVARTGPGQGSVWEVAVDAGAPKGEKVLAQTAEGPNPLFNLCVLDGSDFNDVEVSVAFKAVKGKIDQGGGVVWRYLDENNYYIARYNPLEVNYRLYKVLDGKRIQLATEEGLEAPAGAWHTLAIRMQGNEIACLLNGKIHLEAKDTAFARAGQVGLWTKADAQTRFDDFRAKALTGP